MQLAQQVLVGGRPGQRDQRGKVAQFITVRDGRISAIATYDCYEPF